MNIAQMEYIVALSEDLNISRAAERLYISSSALSQSLTKIENELGYPLFLRNTSPLLITPEGKQFAECCRKMLNLYSTSTTSIENALRNRRKHISLAMSTERMSLLLCYCYPEFKKRFPDHILIQQEGFYTTHAAMIEKGIADLALTPLSPASSGSLRNSLTYERICSEELVLYCNQEHPLFSNYQETGQPVPWTMLTDQYFIQQGKEKYTRWFLDSRFDKKNVHPTILMELNNTDICIQFAEAGAGVTIAPKVFHRKHPDAAVVPLEDPLVWDLHILYLKDKRLSDPEKYICQCIKDLCAWS